MPGVSHLSRKAFSIPFTSLSRRRKRSHWQSKRVGSQRVSFGTSLAGNSSCLTVSYMCSLFIVHIIYQLDVLLIWLKNMKHILSLQGQNRWSQSVLSEHARDPCEETTLSSYVRCITMEWSWLKNIQHHAAQEEHVWQWDRVLVRGQGVGKTQGRADLRRSSQTPKTGHNWHKYRCMHAYYNLTSFPNEQ